MRVANVYDIDQKTYLIKFARCACIIRGFLLILLDRVGYLTPMLKTTYGPVYRAFLKNMKTDKGAIISSVGSS